MSAPRPAVSSLQICFRLFKLIMFKEFVFRTPIVRIILNTNEGTSVLNPGAGFLIIFTLPIDRLF